MPAGAWWEFKDAAVNLGALEPGSGGSRADVAGRVSRSPTPTFPARRHALTGTISYGRNSANPDCADVSGP
jgi:hypothetical protein